MNGIAYLSKVRYTYLRIFFFFPMTTKVTRSTVRGQITLPKRWRTQAGTDLFLMEMTDSSILIKPMKVNTVKKEQILFDADRDNDGKGVSPDEMIAVLKRIQHG